MSAPAKTQALEALVEAHARELHLPAIRARFRALATEAVREQQTPLAYLAALLEAEVQNAQSDANDDDSSTRGSRSSNAWRTSASTTTRRSRRPRSPRSRRDRGSMTARASS